MPGGGAMAALKRGWTLGWQTMKRNTLLLGIAFILVGFVNVLSPTNLIQDWIGPDSGLRGLVLAEVIGMLLPGGPYVVFPLIAVLYSSGAGLGPAVTIITSWSTQALLTISFELPFHGMAFHGHPLGIRAGCPLAGRPGGHAFIWIKPAGYRPPGLGRHTPGRYTPGPG